MNKLQIMKVHALLAAFILPVAVMFVVTGALYTWGIKGSYSNQVHSVNLGDPLRADAAFLTNLAETELTALSISKPEGNPKLKTYGDHFLLEWTGSSKDIILEPGEDAKTATLTIKRTSWYRKFVQLHKAKGGTLFKIYAVIFAVSLVILLFSGFLMAWQTPRLKRATLASSCLGLVFFLVFYLSS